MSCWLRDVACALTVRRLGPPRLTTAFDWHLADGEAMHAKEATEEVANNMPYGNCLLADVLR